MENKDNHLTEEEKRLLELFRTLDDKGRHHVMLAAKSVKTNEEIRRARGVW